MADFFEKLRSQRPRQATPESAQTGPKHNSKQQLKHEPLPPLVPQTTVTKLLYLSSLPDMQYSP